MNLNEQIEKHEKAIKILLLIGECERTIKIHSNFIGSLDNNKWYVNRIKVTEAIKAKLERYYNSSFKIDPLENKEKLVRQLFAGKVSEIIGFKRASKLMEESRETFKTK